MKERPILFSGEMVRAILEGRKTQTRRVIRDNLLSRFDDLNLDSYSDRNPSYETECGQLVLMTDLCPYGQVGDRLWVRETWAYCPYRDCFFYRADNFSEDKFKWKPSIHMIRAASRITLEITGVRVELLQDISEKDAIAEGIETIEGTNVWKNYQIPYPSGWFYPHLPIDSFRTLWDSVYLNWKVNPLVWVIEFKQI